MAKAAKTGNTAKAGITQANKKEKITTERKSLLQEIVESDGTDGLNKKYTDYALSNENGRGFGADYGGMKYNASGDAFMTAYINDRLAGGSPETATQAARKAAGMNTTPTGNSAADRALASGDAYLDEKAGRVMLYDSVNRAAGNGSYAAYEKNSTPEERYAARALATAAAQNPRYSEAQGNNLVIPDFSTGEIRKMDDNGYSRWRAGIDASTQTEKQNPLQAIQDRISRIITPQAGGTTTTWGSEAPVSASAGADGAKPGLENQTENPKGSETVIPMPLQGKTEVLVTADGQANRNNTATPNYLYPESEGSPIRYLNSSPFEDWQKELIDRMNEAFESRDFNEQYRLSQIYNSGYDSYMQDRYSGSLPKGTDPYQGIRDAITAGDRTTYDTQRNTLRANGFSQEQIDEQAADAIHQSERSTREKERDLQNYLGLSAADAEATSVLWWWTDNNGKDSADSDGNGKLKQDELGAYLRQLERGGTLSESQASAIWAASFPKAKTDYSKWKGKQK